jgi:fatty acid desaturase
MTVKNQSLSPSGVQPASLKPSKGQTPKKSNPSPKANEFVELKRMIKQKGLLDKQPGYIVIKLVITLALFALSLVVLVMVANPWLQFLNAIFMAFLFVQIGFIGHDVGHRQSFPAAWKNDMIGLIVGNLLIGISRAWWVDKHNRHHAFSNQLELDPDIELPSIAFSESQALSKRGLLRFIVKYQVYFFFPMLTLVSVGLRVDSVLYLVAKKANYLLAESVLLALHFIWYFGLLYYALGFWGMLGFAVVHQALFGLYMGSVFAPNHKGMLTLEKDTQMDFLHQQVLTSRNVVSHPFIDFWYGGLNYQIEHHLFPGLPRNKLRDAQKIIRPFCEKHQISYHETGFFESYQEILQYLGEVSAPLRQKKAA